MSASRKQRRLREKAFSAARDELDRDGHVAQIQPGPSQTSPVVSSFSTTAPVDPLDALLGSRLVVDLADVAEAARLRPPDHYPLGGGRQVSRARRRVWPREIRLPAGSRLVCCPPEIEGRVRYAERTSVHLQADGALGILSAPVAVQWGGSLQANLFARP